MATKEEEEEKEMLRSGRQELYRKNSCVDIIHERINMTTSSLNWCIATLKSKVSVLDSCGIVNI